MVHALDLHTLEESFPPILEPYGIDTFKPEVRKSLLKLALLRDRVSLTDILKEIAPWPPTEQLFHLEYLRLKISSYINPDIKSEPQCNVLTKGHCYWVDFKFSLRDRVIPSLPPIIYFVELDGRQFHDRTSKEFIEERQRRRELQRKCAKVYTFAGAEVFKNASRCVLEVVTDLDRDLIDRRQMITWASL